jgi:hypothetical protein
MRVWSTISSFERVLQNDGCGRLVEAVNTGSETRYRFLSYCGGLLQSGLIFDTKVAVGVEGSIRLGMDFHFSEPPTVTTGFNVF